MIELSDAGNLQVVQTDCSKSLPFDDEMKVSPCKVCRHLSERLPRNQCKLYLDCPLRVERQPVSWALSKVVASTLPREKVCPICNNTFTRPKNITNEAWEIKSTCGRKCGSVMAWRTRKGLNHA